MTNTEIAAPALADTIPTPNQAVAPNLTEQRRAFFEHLFPDVGDSKFINIHWKSKRENGKGRRTWGGVACQTIGEALAWVARASSAKDLEDIYACTSVQSECRESGRGYRKAVRSSQGAVSQTSLFLDIDVKGQDKNSYGSIAEALNAVGTFLSSIGLQPTMTVSSGGGVHIYIGFDRPISPGEWKPLAVALAEAAKQHGLKCDTQCTVDVSRILRVPGTKNYKAQYGGPVRVEMIGAVRSGYKLNYVKERLAAYQTESVRAAGRTSNLINFPSRPPLRGISDLTAGIETNVEEIRSAALAIPPQAIASEGDWMKLARALAHHARIYPSQSEALYAVLDDISTRAPSYNAVENRNRWERYMSEAYARQNPITIGTLFDLATKHGWNGSQPHVLQNAASAVTLPSNPVSGSSTTTPCVGVAAKSLTAGLGVSFTNVRHRQWLYGTYLVRGQVTFCAAPGGLGKTSFSAALAVELAANRSVLGNKIWVSKPHVLYLNGEDDKEEMARRFWAFCLQHKISEQEIQRLSLLGSDDWRTKQLALMRNERGTSVLNEVAFDHLEQLLRAIDPDVVILDPLISFCGGGNVNDNAVIGQVMGALKGLANKFDCSIFILHHTNKHGEQGSAGAVSGAAALVNLARSVISVMPMTKDDAGKFGVLLSESWRYFRLNTAKANLAPPARDTDWYKFESIELPNCQPPDYPHGDNVQAVVRVNLSAGLRKADPDEEKIRRAILDLVQAGKTISGQQVPYSPAKSGAINERSLLPDALRAVEGATPSRTWDPGDLQAFVERIIDNLKNEGALVKGTIKSGQYRQRQSIGVDWSCTPWPAGATNAVPPNRKPSCEVGSPVAAGNEVDPATANEGEAI